MDALEVCTDICEQCSDEFDSEIILKDANT